jgi:hypothetical protein
MDYVRSGFAEGARAAAGGAVGEGPGYFVKPTVLVDVREDMRVVREEIFGPVVVARPSTTSTRSPAAPTTRPTAWPPASGPTTCRGCIA